MTLFSQSLKWVLMNSSIFGKSRSLIKVGLMIERSAPLMYLWVEPWTAAILRVPKISNMDCGYPGTSPFASFMSMYLLSSGSMDTMVGHPRMWDLKKLPYLPFTKGKKKNTSFNHKIHNQKDNKYNNEQYLPHTQFN